jgi:hypothetical protein
MVDVNNAGSVNLCLCLSKTRVRGTAISATIDVCRDMGLKVLLGFGFVRGCFSVVKHGT